MKKKYFKWMLVILWMILIFVMSNQPGNVSDGNSKFLVRIFDALGLNLNGIFGSLANFVIRKCAHFTEYFIFYLLLYFALREHFSIKRAMLIGIVVVFLYACSDEIHQFFIPGRTSRVRDVLIDTSGGMTAMIIQYILYLSKKLSQNKINS